jgi:hypothetical protein
MVDEGLGRKIFPLDQTKEAFETQLDPDETAKVLIKA